MDSYMHKSSKCIKCISIWLYALKDNWDQRRKQRRNMIKFNVCNSPCGVVLVDRIRYTRPSFEYIYLFLPFSPAPRLSFALAQPPTESTPARPVFMYMYVCVYLRTYFFSHFRLRLQTVNEHHLFYSTRFFFSLP